MASTPVPIRLEKPLIDLLKEGARVTPHKRQELIRLTLRKHLREVIDEEAVAGKGRITNVKPWPKGRLTAAYKAVKDEGWEKVEDAAIRAQGRPSLDD